MRGGIKMLKHKVRTTLRLAYCGQRGNWRVQVRTPPWQAKCENRAPTYAYTVELLYNVTARDRRKNVVIGELSLWPKSL